MNRKKQIILASCLLGLLSTTTAFAANQSVIVLRYLSLPSLNPDTQFILHCSKLGNVLTVTPATNNNLGVAKQVVATSKYVNRSCQLRVEGLNSNGNSHRTSTLATFKFVKQNGLLTVSDFKATQYGQANHHTNVYVKVFGKVIPVTTYQLEHLSYKGIEAFFFQDINPNQLPSGMNPNQIPGMNFKLPNMNP